MEKLFKSVKDKVSNAIDEVTPVFDEASKKLEELKNMKQAHAIEVWRVVSNSDLTEGRGTNTTIALCRLKTTALRVGKGRYVMGTDCPVEQVRAYIIDGSVYTSGNIVEPTPDDINKDIESQKAKTIYEKAKSLGLSDYEIEQLKNK